MVELFIEDNLKLKCPQLTLTCISCNVSVSNSSVALKAEIDKGLSAFANQFTVEDLHNREQIRSTREAYKVLGKAPSRYRPSAEALSRRVLKGKGLYQVNNVVDLLNLLSLETGFSIGGYDEDKILGAARLGIGDTNEPYEAIGRGQLNIENLPFFRDDEGGFGSPTSDSIRTMVTLETKRFLMAIFSFGGLVKKTDIDRASYLLKTFAQATDFELSVID